MGYPRRDYTEETHGFQKVLGPAGSDGKKTLWRIRCVCGKEQVITSDAVMRRKSCGCMTKELLRQTFTTHGFTHHPSFKRWASMIDRWRSSFANFWEDMGPSYKPGLTLDREDNDKGYSPENCRWATPKQQTRNRRSNVFIDTPWGNITISEASERSGVYKGVIADRISRGVSADHLFDKPFHPKIVQKSLGGETIKTWPSAQEVNRQLGFDVSNIHKCCKGRTKYSYGFVWEYT